MSALARRAVFYALLAVLPLSGARACDFARAQSSRWSLERVHGVAWLRTPCGDRFYSLGVNILDGGHLYRRKEGKVWYSWKAFAPSLADWIAETRARLARWGFNTAGGWSLPPRQLKMPAVIELDLGHKADFHWFDPFAPDMQARMTALAKKLVAPYLGSPYRIGYFSDNEVGWWAGALFVWFSEKPASNYTKGRWVAMLRRAYDDDWARFAADFIPPPGVHSWPGLLRATAITHLRPGGHGMAAVREWTRIVAAHYYRLAANAIHAADPGALYFGDRLPIYYDPAAVRAMAPYVDAIAVNYNVDASDGWLARYFFDGLEKLSGGRPILVTEWFFAARRNRTGNKNNGHLMTVDTQAERAAGAASATRNFARIPEVIGSHWFMYYDHPKGGREDGEDYDFGLVDINDRPYRRLTHALAAANREAAAVHAAARPQPLPSPVAPFVVPHAAISLAGHSLADWPKPASLLPPLEPEPGDAAFGEVYLTWSDQGLAVATIGQDYFDSDLLTYRGAFPLGEAYRLEIGVDAGAGPRRFTLFFTPPRTKRHDFAHMRAMLCRGRAERAIAHGCAPVAGAEAVYFGADQPRVTAELRLPWRALGIAAPAPGARLKAAVAMTGWDRDRWMSSSRQPPEAEMADPSGWRALRLGDGIAGAKPAPAGGRG